MRSGARQMDSISLVLPGLRPSWFEAWKLARLTGRACPSLAFGLSWTGEVMDSGDLSVTHSKLPVFSDPQPDVIRMVSRPGNVSTGEKEAGRWRVWDQPRLYIRYPKQGASSWLSR